MKVVPVFISVDPERDTVEQLREYLKGSVRMATSYDCCEAGREGVECG